ncbi:MAG: hypothetical protein DRO18_03490 [Thermoprotei archaeon]|nr:MAG: hypothetical protein DRO18_03490 [Thermoprotei archaeon]
MVVIMVKVLGIEKPVIGMVHLRPLPNTPKYRDESIDELLDHALREAKALIEGGIDAILVENFNDVPYEPKPSDPIVVSVMTLIVNEIRKLGVPVGVNVLRNGCIEALAIAHTAKASFIRCNVFVETIVTDQGIIEPIAPKLMRYKRLLGAGVKVFADIHVKHGKPLVNRPIEEVALEAFDRGLADAVIVTGERTGIPPKMNVLRSVKSAVGDRPVIVGSGVNAENIGEILSIADGVIVGTYLKKNGIVTNPVDVERVKKIMRVANSVRT